MKPTIVMSCPGRNEFVIHVKDKGYWNSWTLMFEEYAAACWSPDLRYLVNNFAKHNDELVEKRGSYNCFNFESYTVR